MVMKMISDGNSDGDDGNHQKSIDGDMQWQAARRNGTSKRKKNGNSKRKGHCL